MPGKILIVDSDEQVTAVLELKLKKENYEVKTISGSVNALKILRDFKPNLIISEMVLPELSGVDFLKRVKMNPETRNIPFIFLSSSRVVEDKILAHEMGAEAFFMKPVLIRVLVNRINDFFDQMKFNEFLDLSKTSKDFKSDLSTISIIDILNIIAENRSSGIVSLNSSTSEEGKIYFSNGSVLRVETKDGENRNGLDELFKLLSWLDGNFVINYKDISVQRNVKIPHDRLVVKAANWLDDYNSELSEMPPLDSKLYLDFGQFMNTINKFPDRVSIIIKNIGPDGSKLGDIIDKTDLDKRLTAGYLKKLIELEVVSVRKKNTPYLLPPEPRWIKGEQEEKKDDFDLIFDKLEKKVALSGMQENFDISKTVVPPPALAQKDTIDPAIGIMIDSVRKEGHSLINTDEFSHEEIPQTEEIPETGEKEVQHEPILEEVLKEKHEENKPAEKPVEEPAAEPVEKPSEKAESSEPETEDYSEQKTEIVGSVHDDEELKSLLEEHLEDIELEDAARKNNPKPSSDSGNPKWELLVYVLLFIISLAVFIAYYRQKKDDFSETAGNQVENTQKVEEKKPVSISENSSESNLSLNELINRAASSYEKQEYGEALRINGIALAKLKNEKADSGENYEKIVTNMAIYLYMTGRFDEALKYAEESLKLRETEKSIELKSAILEELGRNFEAASFLRSKLNDEKFADKREEWVVEINRLEKIRK